MTRKGNKLLADESMTLTNGEAFGKTVWLASSDDGSSWREVTDEQAASLKRENEAVRATDCEAVLNSPRTDLIVELTD